MSTETTPAASALLKEYRLAAGLTQETLAERAGISVRGVQAIEGGTNKPHPGTARRLADALGLIDDERARLLAVAAPTPRRRASTSPPSVLAFTAPWARNGGGHATVEARPPPPADPRNHPAAPEGTRGAARLTSVPRNPYKGLRAFRADDAGDFFGRAALVGQLVAAVESYIRPDAARFLAVVGPSGSGKSSAVLAGLLPQLRRGAVPGSAGWLYLDPLLPGAHPLEALSITLANALPHSSLTAIRADLDASERGLHLLAGRLVRAPETRVLLVVDQAEELFTLTADEDDRRQFIDLLVTAVTEPRGPLVVLLTLRADFYDRPLGYPELGRLVAAQSVAVLPLDSAELRAAIEGPAALPDVGLRFEGDLLGDLVYTVRDQAGALPLLQFTLDQLYARRDGNLLTEAAYRELGGVRGALARQAEATYLGLPDDEHRTLARALFLRLIEPGATAQDTTRRRAALAELELADAARTARLRAVAEAFIAARLLTATASGGTTLESGGGTTLEVSHEALIREWDRLGAWLHAAREDVRMQVRLSADAAAWQHAGQPIDLLYRGTVLTSAQGWAARNTPSAREEAFLTAAADQERQQEAAERVRQARELALARRAAAANRQAAVRLRALAAVLAVFLLAAGGLAALAQTNANQARAARNLALSRQLAAQAMTRLGGQYDLALLLSLAAQHIAPTVEARDSLLRGLQAAPSGLLTFLHGHTLPVNSVAISPNGALLASGSADGTIQLWDIRRRRAVGAPLRSAGGTIYSVAFSPDGSTLAAGSADGIVHLWSVAGLRRLVSPYTFSCGCPVTSVVFSPDGTTLAAGGWSNTIQLWDVAHHSALPFSPLQGDTSTGNSGNAFIASLAFSPDGKILASGSPGGPIQLWDATTGDYVGLARGKTGTLRGHTDAANGLAFSPDGTMLASASADHTVRLWDVARQREIGPPLRGHTGGVHSVVFSPDGTMLASGGLDGSVRLWDVRRHRQLGAPLLGHTGQVDSVVFSGDGTMLAAGTSDGTVALWQMRRLSLSATLTSSHGSYPNLTISPDGKTLAVDIDNNAVQINTVLHSTVQLWDMSRRSLRHALRVSGSVQSMAFSPDSRMLVVGDNGPESIVQMWDVASGQPLGQPIATQQQGVGNVAFSSDGTMVAAAGIDGTIQLWSVARRPRGRLSPLGAPLIGDTAANMGWILGLAFSPDGKTLASSGSDRMIRLWDVARHRQLGAPLAGNTSPVRTIAFSPNGALLASGSDDGAVRLWNVARHRQIGPPLAGHTDLVHSVAFSPDGTMLASGSEDGTVRLWDVSSQQPLGAPLAVGIIAGLAFSPDGQTLATGSMNGTVRLWDVDLRTWPRVACRIANRNLTRQEWRQYLGDLPYATVCPGLPTVPESASEEARLAPRRPALSHRAAGAVPGWVRAAVAPSAAKTLRIGWAVDAGQLDPVSGWGNSSIWVTVNIYDTLIRADNDGASLTPDLAASWDISHGGTVYTFHLRPGVVFHNGQKLTAADVKFCLDRARDHTAFYAWTLAAIKNVAAPNPATVVVTLTHPWAPFLSDVALFDAGVYPMAYFKQVGQSYMALHPVGSGPYTFDSWWRGRYLRLKKNPHYWAARQFPMQYVEFDVAPDANARLRMAETGQLDVDNVLPPSQVAALKRNHAVKAVIDASTAIDYFSFNTRFAPFDDVRVRQAISHAIDRAAIIKTVLHGLGTPANSFIPRGAIDYSAGIPVPAHDLSLARRLLRQSPIPHGFALSVEVPSGNAEYEQTARVFQSEMAPLGVKVTVKTVDPNTWFPASNQRFLFENQWTNDISDPDELVTFAAGNAPGTANMDSYYNSPAAALSRQAEQTSGAAARRRLYDQIQRIWARDVWFIALYDVPFVNAVNSHVHGFHENPLGFFVLQGVHKS